MMKTFQHKRSCGRQARQIHEPRENSVRKPESPTLRAIAELRRLAADDRGKGMAGRESWLREWLVKQDDLAEFIYVFE